MQQHSESIAYYESLNNESKLIVKTAALMSFDITLSSIQHMTSMSMKATQTYIKNIMDDAYQYGLFESRYSGSSERVVSVWFLIYIAPSLSGFGEIWSRIKLNSRYYDNPVLKNLRDYLYTLCHQPKEFKAIEEYLLMISSSPVINKLTEILSVPAYRPFFKEMNIDILEQIISTAYAIKTLTLEPLDGLTDAIEYIKSEINPGKHSLIYLIQQEIALCSGELTQIESFLFLNYQLTATESLFSGKSDEALVNFNKGIKEERAYIKSLLLPSNLNIGIFYIMALMINSNEAAIPVFIKLKNSLSKKIYTSCDSIYKCILCYATNNKPEMQFAVKDLFFSIENKQSDIRSLLSIIALYLIEEKPKKEQIMSVVNTVKKAIDNGYFLLANEAAYVVNQWYNIPEMEELSNQLTDKTGYKPAVSQISRQEEWEKSLSVLLNVSGGKPSLQTDADKNKLRVVYFFDPRNGFIQPTLQTKTSKGWSKGRNISLKKFADCTTEGMLEIDFRVARCVRHTSSWGGDEYYLSDSAIKELVGHPYVFLYDSENISVELIAAEPVIHVVKTKKGYSLTTDIMDATNPIVVKETNTRYKIYNLTNKQKEIIKAIKQHNIIIPEHGKEKLTPIIGYLSAHMAVHSDLQASTGGKTKVKDVDADSRIRVQLLPLGSGLKAELFAKPFGAHPPYCKPGKGGKVLLANEHGEQLQVKRELKKEIEYADTLLMEIQSIESMEMNDGVISFEEPMDSLLLLDILTAHQDKCVVEWPEGERFKVKGSVDSTNLSLRLKSKTNWFELQGELKISEDTIITVQQLLTLTENGYGRFVELGKGEFIALSEKLRKQLEELRVFSNIEKNNLQINKFASMALGDFFSEVRDFKSDKSWKEFQKKLDNAKVAEISLPATLQADLRPYQEDGFYWLARLADLGGGACLADDMGLGKTVQTLAVLLHRAHLGPAVVICPVSVVPNWKNEVEKFAPTLCVKTLQNGNREQTIQSLEAGDLLITSYGLLQTEENALCKTQFATAILDEAHTIKNFTTKTSKAAMQLQASFRVALTGTPLQNHLGEIWNLFNFINPGLLGNLKQFTESYIKSDTESARKHLRKLISPFILRRTKSAVLDELPAKTEIVKKIELSEEERAYYEMLRRQAIETMENDDSPQGAKHLKALAEITRLRQASCNPKLVNKDINISSSKLAAFLEIVSELIDNKHRALVFSQFVSHLSIVREALDYQGIKYKYLDGSTPMAEREKEVKAFQAGDGELFLISLKAGGLGLNLTAADYVIHLDPWWNPAIEDQASDRAHRFGQKRPVTIYRLVAEDTIEEKIIQLHHTKRDLADSLLEGSDQSARLSVTELLSLIKDQI